jgi:hypothetical protein
MELDTRRLYLAEGCSSLFGYCTQVLRLSEHAAYGRIEAARAARRFPAVLDLLEDGSITLTTVTLVAAHLTAENAAQVLASARHRSKRDVEEQIVARLRPLPDVAASVLKLPAPAAVPMPVAQTTAAGCPAVDTGQTLEVPAAATRPPTQAVASAAHRPVIAPLAPERYKVQFTVSRETHDKLRRAQDLLRHTIPDGDTAAVIDRALTALLKELAREKFAATGQPQASRGPAVPASRSRYIPAAVKRAVWVRDVGRCAFVGKNERRCHERGFVEFHHVQPYAAGGPATVQNIELRCRLCRARHKRHYADSRIMPSGSLPAAKIAVVGRSHAA